MKTLKEILIKEKCHLRNLFIEVNEELRNLNLTEHSIKRKDQSNNNTEDINKNEIIEIVNKCDNLIVDKLLNNKIAINTGKEHLELEN